MLSPKITEIAIRDLTVEKLAWDKPSRKAICRWSVWRYRRADQRAFIAGSRLEHRTFDLETSTWAGESAARTEKLAAGLLQ
jgi:hypothetical protein